MTEKVSASPLKCSKPAEIFRTNEVLNLMDADAVNTDGLRELPAPAIIDPGRYGIAYTADQMRAYAKPYADRLAAVEAELAEAREVLRQSLDANIDTGESLRTLAHRASNALYWRNERAERAEAELAALRADARGHEQTLRAALEFVSKFTSGNSVMRDVRAIAVRAGPTIAQEATFLRDQINARLLPDSGEVQPPHDDGEG